jgi:hypothetical protein
MPTSPTKHAAYIRRKYHEDTAYRAKHLQLVKKNKEKNRERMRAILDGAKANGCQLCPEREPCCMSFHHVNPAEKRFGVGNYGSRQPSLENFIAELAKCICVCENCHRKIHAGVIVLPTDAPRVVVSGL